MGIKEDLQRRHPDYLTHAPDWHLAHETWKGGWPYIDKHLLRLTDRESPKAFSNRKAIARFRNTPAAIGSRVIQTIFGAPDPVIRETRQPVSESVRTASDRRGRPIDDFIREVAQWDLVFGWCAVLVLRAAMDDRAYACIVTPLQITDWDLDRNGNLAWIRIRREERVADPFGEPKTEVSYLTMTPDAWVEHTADGTVKTDPDTGEPLEGEYQLEIQGEMRIPIAFSYFEPSHDSLAGKSFFVELCREAKTAFNLQSQLERGYVKNMNQLLALKKALTVQDPTPNADALVLFNTIEYTADEPPRFIGVDPSGWSEVREAITEIDEGMYRTAKQRFRTDSTVSESGLAKAQDEKGGDNQAMNFAMELAKTELGIFTIAEAWGGQAFAGSVTYPRKFNTLFEGDYLDNFERVRTLYGDLSPTAVKDEAVETYKRIRPHVTPQQLQMIETEIEAATLAQAQALSAEV
jgi:hypothetical protein